MFDNKTILYFFVGMFIVLGVGYSLTGYATSGNIGKIYVSSNPTGANVYLDGVFKGVTYLTITKVSVGNHNLKLTKQGYFDYPTNIDVYKGKTSYVNAVLQTSNSSNITYTTTTSTSTSSTTLAQTNYTTNQACIVRDDFTNMPSSSDPNLGLGYAKQHMTGNFDITSLRTACTESIYINLMQNYCTINTNAAQWQIVFFGGSTGCDDSGCLKYRCHDQYIAKDGGACLIFGGGGDVYSITKYDPDTGSKYIKQHIPGNYDITSLRTACTDTIFWNLFSQYCQTYPNDYAQWLISDMISTIGGSTQSNWNIRYCSELQNKTNSVCIVRDSYTNLPSPNDPDIGTGYAKKHMPGANDITTLRTVCDDTIYQQLMQDYCTINTNPVQWEAAILGGVHGCDDSGCNFYNCNITTTTTTSTSTSSTTALSTTCTDSDGGINYYIKGTVVNGNYSKTDYCEGLCQLREYYCTSLSFTGIGSTSSMCPIGYRCVDGVFIDQTNQVGNLNILSTPQSANIFLNNNFIGLTPLLLENLGAGKIYNVTLEKTGYYNYTTQAYIYGNYTLTINAVLNSIVL